MLQHTFTKSAGACGEQAPSQEGSTSVLPSSNNGSTGVLNCQVDDIFSFLGEDSAEGLPEGPEKFPCGAVTHFYRDPLTGSRKYFPLLCGDFRHCDTCHTKRRKKYQWRVQVGLMYYPVAVVELSDPRAADLVSMLDKKQYLRLPATRKGHEDDEEQAEQGGALFFDWNDETKPLFADDDILDHFVKTGTELPKNFPWDWDELVNTPQGQRPSGSMGKHLPDEKEKGAGDEGELVSVEVIRFAINSEDNDKANAAFTQSEMETSDLDPQNLGELQDALAARAKADEKALKQREVKIMFKNSVTMQINISDMSWSVSDKSSIDNSSIQRQKTGEQLKFT